MTEKSSPRASRARYITDSRPPAGSGEQRIVADTLAEIHALERESRSKPPSRWTDRCKREAKHDFAAERHRAGLGIRETARLLGVDESLIRAWEDGRDMRRHPPKWATHALGRAARLLCARRLVDYVRAVDGDEIDPVDAELPPSGTDG